MAYEKEAIADSPSALPAQQAQVMREERVYDPYRVKGPRALIGQTDKNSGTLAPEEPRPTEETVKLSPQAAALARMEMKSRQREQELKKREAALAAERAEFADFKAMKEKIAAKDYSVLDGVGVDYNEYSQYQLNKLNGTDPVQAEIARLSNKTSEIEKSIQDNVSKQFDAAVSERKLAAKQFIESSSELPAIKRLGVEKGRDAIVQHILDTWEHDKDADGNPVELSIEQAAKEVEAEVHRRAKAWAGLLEDNKEVPVEGEKKQLPPLKSGLKTLTNQVTAGDLKRSMKPLHNLPDSERWAEAKRRAEERLQQQLAR